MLRIMGMADIKKTEEQNKILTVIIFEKNGEARL